MSISNEKFRGHSWTLSVNQLSMALEKIHSWTFHGYVHEICGQRGRGSRGVEGYHAVSFFENRLCNPFPKTHTSFADPGGGRLDAHFESLASIWKAWMVGMDGHGGCMAMGQE